MKEQTNSEIFAYKFSDTATEIKPVLFNEEHSTPIEFLKFKYQRGCFFGLDNLMNSGHYKLLGWSFDFTPFLKRFVYSQYGHWTDVYAPNRTALRNATYGKIDCIVDIPSKK